MQVVGEAGNGCEGLSLARQLVPDVVLMDLRMPGSGGLEACRMIKAEFPAMRVIILTSYSDDELLFDAISAGADGYVLKQIGSEDLMRALQRVSQGECLIDPLVTHRVLAKVRQARKQEQAQAFACLSAQEMQILARIVEGKTNREIGGELHLSEKTVRNYISDILTTLGVTSRAQAAAYAARNRIEDFL
jgi:DNA-binding NarL/FixJ family response regulator